MIKGTFHNLPQAKKQRIISAIAEEFSHTDTNRVSINNIIKNANISRGSFYQYFDDKIDLVEVMIKYYLNQIGDSVTEVIHLSRGDLFYTFEECFSIICQFGENPKDKNILKRIFISIYSDHNIISEYIKKRFSGFEEIDEMISMLSRKNLKEQDDVFFKNLTGIIMAVLKSALAEYFVREKDLEEVKKDYLQKINIIKTGAAV